MGYQLIHFDNIDSTNLYIKKHFKELDDFTFISSSYQEKGRGRNDHTWLSNKGENLLISLLIKDKEVLKYASMLSLTTAISIVKLLEKEGYNNVLIKWPNDIFINYKKVAGILLESQLPEFVVIGIGLNVNQKEFRGSYKVEPTSLFLEKKSKVNLDLIKEKLCDILVNNIISFNLEKDIEVFNLHNYLLNKEISYTIENESKFGLVIGIDSDFSLLVKEREKVIKLRSGEVNIKLN